MSVFPNSPPRIPITMLDWKPFQRNSLRGFASIRIGAWLIVRDVAVHVTNGRPGAALAAKPILGADGTAQRDDARKIKYVQLMEWTDKAPRDRFSLSVIEAVEREHPEALEPSE